MGDSIMHRADILRMARESDMDIDDEASGWGEIITAEPADLERFAALVAASERERIKEANAPEIEKINAHIKALENAVVAEREACANLCEEHWRNNGNAMECADAIRARGKK